MNTPTPYAPSDTIAREASNPLPALSPDFYAKLHNEAVRHVQRRKKTILRIRIASGIAATLALVVGISVSAIPSRNTTAYPEQMARTVMTLTEGYAFNSQGDFSEQFLAFQEAPGMF